MSAARDALAAFEGADRRRTFAADLAAARAARNGAGDASREGIRWLDVGRLMAEDPPPVDWLVEPLVARGALTLLVGPPGVGKSMFAFAAVAAVAHGAPSLAGMPVTRGEVAVLDAENGERTLHQRAHLANLPPERVRLGVAEGFSLRDDGDIDALRSALATDAPALLVLDSLASLAPELKEERADEVAPVFDRLRRLAQETGVAILLLHHTRKEGDTYRGGTGIPAGVDVLAVFGRPRDSTDRERRELDWSLEKGGKMRLGPEPEPLELRLAVAGGRLTLDAVGDEPPGDRERELRDELARHLGERPGEGVEAIARAVHRRAEHVRAALTSGARDGVFERDPSQTSDGSGRGGPRKGWYLAPQAASLPVPPDGTGWDGQGERAIPVDRPTGGTPRRGAPRDGVPPAREPEVE